MRNRFLSYVLFSLCFFLGFSSLVYAHRLSSAAEHGRIEELHFLLRLPEFRDHLVNKPNSKGDTALIAAVRKNQAQVVRILSQHPQINFAVVDKKGKTALNLAASSGSHSLVIILLMNGARPTVNMANHRGQTPLISSAKANHLRVVDILLAHSEEADPNIRDGKNKDLLMWSIKFGHMEIVELVATFYHHRLSKLTRLTALRMVMQYRPNYFLIFKPLLARSEEVILTEREACQICQQSFIKDQTVSMLGECGHRYHDRCLRRFIKRSDQRKCPICREPFILEEARDGVIAEDARNGVISDDEEPVDDDDEDSVPDPTRLMRTPTIPFL